MLEREQLAPLGLEKRTEMALELYLVSPAAMHHRLRVLRTANT